LLATSDAGRGEDAIRRWVIENDGLEAIVALPAQPFYNTGILSYVWRARVTERMTLSFEDAYDLVDRLTYYEHENRGFNGWDIARAGFRDAQKQYPVTQFCAMLAYAQATAAVREHGQRDKD
jgi:hypothetical protein